MKRRRKTAVKTDQSAEGRRFELCSVMLQVKASPTHVAPLPSAWRLYRVMQFSPLCLTRGKSTQKPLRGVFTTFSTDYPGALKTYQNHNDGSSPQTPFVFSILRL